MNGNKKNIVIFIVVLFCGFNVFGQDKIVSDSLAVVGDSLSVTTDTLTAKKKEYIDIQPTRFLNNNEKDLAYSAKDMAKSDYRYIGDLMEKLPFTFLQNLGSQGAPSELTMYGLSGNNVSYMRDGILQNERYYGAFNLNQYQSESIDSVESLPISRGFVYGYLNSPVSVNFVSRNHEIKKPFSRMRYYQGSNEEGYIDVIFQTRLFKKVNFGFDVTNVSVDSRYDNSEIGIWKVSTYASGKISEKVKLFGEYSHYRWDAELNGGAINDINLYDSKQALVVYPSRNEQIVNHSFKFGVVSKLIPLGVTQIDFYHQFYQDNFKQNTKFKLSTIPEIREKSKQTVEGLKVVQQMDLYLMKLDAIATVEKIEHSWDNKVNKINESILSLAGKAQFDLFGDNILPTAYAKTLTYNEQSYWGIGGDVRIKFGNNFSVFGGLSTYQKPVNLFEAQYVNGSTKQNVSTLEAGVQINGEYLSGRVAYFVYNNDNEFFPIINEHSDTMTINEIGSGRLYELNLQGLNAAMELNLWKIQMTGNATYYINYEKQRKTSLPEFTFNGGIYYVDKLFNDNLDLKAGFNFSFFTEKSYITYDFFNKSGIRYITANQNAVKLSDEKVPATNQLDFFVAGQIQRKATLYFTFENILDNEYYIVPYYPMWGRGMRIGVSWEFID